MENKLIMEYILQAFVNEMDDIINKMQVSDEMDSVRLTMADGSKFLIRCEKIED